MFSRLYQSFVIEKPKLILTLLILFLISFGYHTKDFKLDASSDTLLIENDPDLKYLREVTNRYGAKEFLILTYAPNEKLISVSSYRVGMDTIPACKTDKIPCSRTRFSSRSIAKKMSETPLAVGG